MFDTLRRLYMNGDLSKAQLNRAVQKGWITELQKNQILAMS